jgi:hypothetical protein
MKKTIILLFLFVGLQADCIYGAKDSRSFQVIDSNTLILKGYKNILVKTFCFIYPSSNITVLKDSFCDYDSSVLYIDGEVCDTNEVRDLN